MVRPSVLMVLAVGAETAVAGGDSVLDVTGKLGSEKRKRNLAPQHFSQVPR